MKQTIKILDEHTANQIAAGEVVDRPASVIKELVENAIDAGGTRIEVRIEEGGLSRIQVLDNGTGMNREDCVLAFNRHATSKISEANDLLSIRTLGFRGEALPSIAAVSKVQLVSKPHGVLEGTMVKLEGGKLVTIETVGCPTGTDIIVQELFFNTPARKKYLRKPATEATHAIKAVQRLALAYPELSFQLWHNGQQVFSTSGVGQLRDILIDLYGLEFAENMISISYLTPTLELKGLVGKSFQHRSSRDQQIFFVNGRYVRSSLMQATLEEAYRGLLPSRRYPVAIIFLSISPETLDVNVHPAKLEVKFAYPEQVSSALGVALAKALKGAQHIPLSISNDEYPHPLRRTERVQEAVDTYLQTQWTGSSDAKMPALVSFASLQKKQEEKANISKRLNLSFASLKQTLPDSVQANEQFPQLIAIGQLHDSFILAQGNDGLYVIDQHGAHERINFEYLQDKVAQQSKDAQALAIPSMLELNPVESELLISRIVQLTELGIIIEHFGKNTFLIRAVPPGLRGEEASELVMDLLQEWDNRMSHGTETIENALKLVACRQAIMAKKHLSLAEQQALLEKLSELRQPFTCPHGRPIVINYELKELLRRFGRN